MKIGFLQYAPQSNTLDGNIDFIIHMTRNVHDALIVLPELFLTSYYTFEPLEKNQIKKILVKLFAHSKNNNIAFVGSLAIKNKSIIHNQGVYISQGKIKGTYTKRKLYDNEKKIFSPGEKQYKIFTYKNIRLTIQICIDNSNPTNARKATQKGIILLAAPSTVSVDFLKSILKARSLENQIITVFCNRVGKEANGITYCGKSTIFLPNGTEMSASTKNYNLKLHTIFQRDIDSYLKTRLMLLKL